MAKIDEVKELLNTLRLLFSIGIGLVVVLTGALINKEATNSIDIYFWIGSVVEIITIIVLLFIAKSIKRNITKIRDL
jgi:Na+/melibiose symporter-like transporter